MTLRILREERQQYDLHPELNLSIEDFVHRLRFFQQNISRARNRTQPKLITITGLDCVLEAHRQGWLCAITDQQLEFQRGGQYYRGQWRNPRSATIDRVNSDLGYEPGNIQILTDIANCLKSHYSHQELETLCRGYLRNFC